MEAFRNVPTTIPIPKVSCFIRHPTGGRLLVFTHPDFPNAGTQVPAGTVEPNEDPAVAAIREAEEETGFAGYKVLRFLDRQAITEVRQGEPQVHDRWFFELTPPDGLPEEWDHGEGISPDSEDWIRFHFFWIDPTAEPSPLTPDHAAVLRSKLLGIAS